MSPCLSRAPRGLRGLLSSLLMASAFVAAGQEPQADEPPSASPPAEIPAATEPAAEPSSETDPEAAPSSVPAQLDVKIDLQQITVGDRVEAEITLVWMGEEPSAPPRFPTWQSTWGRAEVLKSSEIEAQIDPSGRRIYRQALTLTAFEVGTISLPTITVAVPLEKRTEIISSSDSPELEVVSVLPASATEDADQGADQGAGGDTEAAPDLEARPAAPLIQRPPQEAFYWTTGVLAVLTVLMALALIRRLQSADPRAAASRRPLLPPLEELVSNLRTIDPTIGSEPAHTELSLALRRYLGRTLDFQAVEGTTSEIQKRLRGTAVPPTATQRAVRLLRDCDQVKFARQEVNEQVTDDRIRLAESLAREVEEQLRPAPQEPSEAPDGAAPEAAR